MSLKNSFLETCVLSFVQFKHLPLYLEWAPQNVFTQDRKHNHQTCTQQEVRLQLQIFADGRREKRRRKRCLMCVQEEEAREIQAEAEDLANSDHNEDEIPEPDTVLFVKNLNFESTEDALREVCCISLKYSSLLCSPIFFSLQTM